jgi:hypothetical protein
VNTNFILDGASGRMILRILDFQNPSAEIKLGLLTLLIINRKQLMGLYQDIICRMKRHFA